MTGSTFAVLSVTSFRFQLVTGTSKQSVFPYMFMRTVSVCHLPSLHCHFLFLSDRTSKVFTAMLLQLHINLLSWVACLPPPKPSVYGARSSSACPWHSGEDVPSSAASAYPRLKVTESRQLTGIALTPGSRHLDICWPPYAKVAAWPAS